MTVLPMPVTSTAPAHAGRETLLRCLVEERELLISYATRILGARDQAEDVLQDAAIRCLESAAIAETIDNPRGMARRVVRNLALDRARQTGRAPLPMPEDAEFACDRPRAEKSVEDRELLSRLCGELGRLPRLHRSILLDHRLEREAQIRIARRVNLSPARVNAIIAMTHDTLQSFVNMMM